MPVLLLLLLLAHAIAFAAFVALLAVEYRYPRRVDKWRQEYRMASSLHRLSAGVPAWQQDFDWEAVGEARMIRAAERLRRLGATLD